MHGHFTLAINPGECVNGGCHLEVPFVYWEVPFLGLVLSSSVKKLSASCLLVFDPCSLRQFICFHHLVLLTGTPVLETSGFAVSQVHTVLTFIQFCHPRHGQQQNLWSLSASGMGENLGKPCCLSFFLFCCPQFTNSPDMCWFLSCLMSQGRH